MLGSLYFVPGNKAQRQSLRENISKERSKEAENTVRMGLYW